MLTFITWTKQGFATFYFNHAKNEHVQIFLNDDDDDDNNNNSPETRKYWVDVQRGIVSSHGEKDPL